MDHNIFVFLKKQLLQTNKILQSPVAKIAFGLSLTYLLFPHHVSSTAYMCESEPAAFGFCPDPSWQLSINMAVQQGLVFGNDYVLTYGPLGFLNTRNALGIASIWFILFDLFVLLNFLYIFLYAIRRYRSLPWCLLCLLTAYTVSFTVFGLLLISHFWLNHALEHKQIRGFYIAGFISCVAFYVKFNTSFIGLLFFYAYLGVSLLTQKQNLLPKLLAGSLVPIVILMLSIPLHTNIPAYVRGGLNLINGYNDAMGLEIGIYRRVLVLAIAVAVLFFSVFWGKNLKARLLLLTTSLLFTFVVFKQAFVRSDFFHATDFFDYFPGVCFVGLLFLNKASPLKLGVTLVACLTCLLANWRLNLYPKKDSPLNYVQEVVSPPDLHKKFANALHRFRLPDTIHRVIGRGSVDVVPWNIEYIYFNHLRYNPRPVIQSYTVYTPYLINVNKQKYESDSAPDFVFFSSQALDDRYPFFDDQGVKLALVSHYACIDFFDSAKANPFLLFKKSPGHAKIRFSSPKEQSTFFSKDYALNDTAKSYYVKFSIDYTFAGKTLRTLYKPPQLRIRFTLANDSTRTYRVISPILKSGVLINPLIEDEKDFLNFANGLPVPAEKKIKSFRIELNAPAADRVAEAAYEKTIKLLVSEVLITRN